MNFKLEEKFLKPASQSNNLYYGVYITKIWKRKILWKPGIAMIDSSDKWSLSLFKWLAHSFS